MGRRRGRGKGRVRDAEPADSSRPSFVELLAPRAGREVLVELEDARGTKVRILLRDGGAFDFGVLGRALPGRRG